MKTAYNPMLTLHFVVFKYVKTMSVINSMTDCTFLIMKLIAQYFSNNLLKTEKKIIDKKMFHCFEI